MSAHDFDPVRFPDDDPTHHHRLCVACWVQRAAFWLTMAGVVGLWALSLLGLI